ncbi:heme peroxidase [Syncephalastrum racemosum]|uniref:Heme peroxidase n=1 Tax=Syncephalastrum racemosum TaxID=13706 RepID=A0A1X2HA84_SYNRA|nr:heme peroxidase [Syncephalastrum racemosum]
MLSHFHVAQRRSNVVSKPTPVPSKSNGLTGKDQQESKAFGWLQTIHEESGEPGLLRALHALVLSVHEHKDGDKKNGNNIKSIMKRALGTQNSATTDPFVPTPSNEPDGFEWTVGALIKNLETILGLTPTNTKAIKELLGLPISHQVVLIKGIIERLLSTNAPVNDRHNTFEAVMKILGTMGPKQEELMFFISQPLNETFYNDIARPPINFVGNNYRTADGSYNSIWFPNAGMAGTKYARTVTSTQKIHDKLPAPEVVFEKLLKRREFVPHPGGINMLLLYLGILITHDLFYTDPNDPTVNVTTSYADLSTLYGFNRTDQESVREMRQGLLKPDQWFDKRLVIQPAGVAALLVLFSRNHNYIAQQLLERNENDQFSYGPDKDLKTAEEQDERLFQTARLINNGCYANIILHEYVRTILGISPDSYFLLNPFATPSNPVYGNSVSIEFNIIYRWHMAIGQEDEAWLNKVMELLGSRLKTIRDQKTEPKEGGTDQGIFDQLLPEFNKEFVKATPEELAKGLPMAGAHRDIKTGAFSDFDLTRALRNGYTQIASELGYGFKTPASLAHVEVMGIKQARMLKTCTFNDLRRHLNLMALTSFKDFSDDEEIQQNLEELYGHPDNVELYAGVMVERPKVTGLRLPYTMERAIVSDAVNLLRNDRLLTQELTPSNLTNWGYEYQSGDPNRYGRILPTMLTNLLKHANANNQPAFSDEEVANLFNVPGFQHKG